MCPVKSQSILLLNRVDLGKMIQFISGHGHWGRHLVLCKLQVEDQCQLCNGNSVESPEHLLHECLGRGQT